MLTGILTALGAKRLGPVLPSLPALVIPLQSLPYLAVTTSCDAMMVWGRGVYPLFFAFWPAILLCLDFATLTMWEAVAERCAMRDDALHFASATFAAGVEAARVMLTAANTEPWSAVFAWLLGVVVECFGRYHALDPRSHLRKEDDDEEPNPYDTAPRDAVTGCRVAVPAGSGECKYNTDHSRFAVLAAQNRTPARWMVPITFSLIWLTGYFPWAADFGQGPYSQPAHWLMHPTWWQRTLILLHAPLSDAGGYLAGQSLDQDWGISAGFPRAWDQLVLMGLCCFVASGHAMVAVSGLAQHANG